MDSIFAAFGSVSPLSQSLLFIPELLGERFFTDPSTILTAVGIIWALSKLLHQAYSSIETFIERHLTCSISITEEDHLYDYVMKFMSQHSAVRSSRQLTAETAYHGAWDDEGKTPTVLCTGGSNNCDFTQYLNYSQQNARQAPRFTPSPGQTGFWHEGRYFWFGRFRETYGDSSGWGLMKDIESISVSCYGRSTKPIKDFLDDSKALYLEELSQKTTIYRPRATEMRRDYGVWQQVARRPIRPLRTVVLDNQIKEDILRDVNEYLHPITARWYASRGIPLRRGYLFHGPPGTGKTSFSFAIAGVFGLDIYVISLQDGSLSEEDLNSLFLKLPRRCVVLLEDIDSAGICREGELSNGQRKETGKNEKQDSPLSDENDKYNVENVLSDCELTDHDEHDFIGKSNRRGREVATQGKNKSNKISLAGLLNAIDGVASHEGRVLIMTTNSLESLDEALVRPGRVDMEARFTMATYSQIQELFQRMYEPSKPQKLDRALSAPSEWPAAPKRNEVLMAIAREVSSLDVDGKRLADMAIEFAKQIPTDQFSPAEIQGFLLMRKESPRKALQEVSRWVDTSLKQKQSRFKIVVSQY